MNRGGQGEGEAACAPRTANARNHALREDPGPQKCLRMVEDINADGFACPVCSARACTACWEAGKGLSFSGVGGCEGPYVGLKLPP